MYPLCAEISLPNDYSPFDNLLDANSAPGEDPFEQFIFASLFEETDTPSDTINPALLALPDMTQSRSQLEPLPPKAQEPPQAEQPPQAEPPQAEPPQAEPPQAEPPQAEPPQAEPLQGTNEDDLGRPQEEQGLRDVAGEQHRENLDRQPSQAISESTIPLTPSAYRGMMEETPVRQERGASAGNPIPIEDDELEPPSEGDGRDGPAGGSEEEPKSQKRKRELIDPAQVSPLTRSSKRLKDHNDVSSWIYRVIARKREGPKTMYKVDWAGNRVEVARLSECAELDDFKIEEIIDFKEKEQRSTALIIWRPSWVDAADLVSAEAQKNLRVFEDKCASGESFWEEEDGYMAQYVT